MAAEEAANTPVEVEALGCKVAAVVEVEWHIVVLQHTLVVVAGIQLGSWDVLLACRW